MNSTDGDTLPQKSDEDTMSMTCTKVTKRRTTESATPMLTKKSFPNETVRMQLAKIEKDIEKTVERILVSKDRTGRLILKLKALWAKKESLLKCKDG